MSTSSVGEEHLPLLTSSGFASLEKDPFISILSSFVLQCSAIVASGMTAVRISSIALTS